MITIKSASNPVYETADKKFISLQVDTVEHGVIPVICDENYDYEHGRLLYAKAIAGGYGVIGDYVIPVILPQPISTGVQLL